ncbi:tape measure protein [Spirosoma spitsbergense]|uniref:tape measure protein n=1 Tax=Spirosoma spitsbergense TaxID=431554 RepID=UPI00035F65D3|nr:tape measure protein [Spirosoma spitsbergense]
MIDHDDLFSESKILASIARLLAANKEFGESVINTNSRIGKTVQEQLTLLAKYKVQLEGLRDSKDVFGFAKEINETTSAIRANNGILSQNKSLVDSNNKVIEQMSSRLAELQKEYETLDLTQKKDVARKKEIQRELTSTTRAVTSLTSATSVAGRTVKAAENSFDALKQQTRDLKRSLDALPNSYDRGTNKINEQNRAAVALNAQYQKNIASINAIERGQKNFRGNVGNYPTAQSSGSSLSSIGSLAAGAAGVGSVAIVADKILSGLKSAGEIILQFDSLDSALKVVSNDTNLFTQRQAMLSKVSDDLGQDLSVVEKTYTNLTASSKGTRLEGEATDKIFTAITGTMGRLKKPGQDTERALLAIGQVMSKGVLASEELRGQLGEVIPNAFGIASKAMGVTTQKLGDMLKNGEVLASDFLPKFAAELERTFNPNHEQRVEGLAANLARLRNENVEWLKSINIGDKAGEFIGNITKMARSVREYFSPAFVESTRIFNEQTDSLNTLESTMPGLLSRYDELKSKSKLSTDEQKELQTVINNLTSLAPSAATGFDAYGNALDINKGKVLSFTAAQRQLNAELNKQAIADVTRQAGADMSVIQDRQKKLNSGKELKGPIARVFSGMNDRYQSISDERSKELQGEIDTKSESVISKARQIMSMGGVVNGALRKYVENSSDYSAKQLLLIDDYNKKITDKQAVAADLFQKGAKKQREVVVKEIGKLKAELGQIINPTLPGEKSGSDKPELSQAAANKAKAAAEKQLSESLRKSQSVTGDKLANLDSQRQDGLITEQQFIEDRLKITLDGLNNRQALLEKAGKKETDDYINIQKEKKKADTEYSRSQLQLDLKSNKGKTDASLSGLDKQRSEGDMSDLSYIDKRHELIVAGIERDQVTLREAGQAQTELFKATDTALQAEQSDYLDKRLQAIKKSFKEELGAIGDSLKTIDQQAGADYETRLAESKVFYNSLRQQVEEAEANGRISPTDARNSIQLIDINETKAELTIFQQIIEQSKTLTHSFIDDRIEQLKNYIAFSNGSEKELFEYKKEIADLERLREKSDADDAIALQKKVADNDIAVTDKVHQNKKQKSAEEKQMARDVLNAAIQGGASLVNALFESGQQGIATQQADLEKRQAFELSLVGDSEAAKAAIQQKYQAEKNVLAHKADVAARESALFNIAIAGAQGVLSALASIPPNVPLSFVIGGLALAQAAIVASRPLPQYFAGKNIDGISNDTYAGPAIAGERGRELWHHDGQVDLLNKATLINVGRNDVIYPNHITEMILNKPRMFDARSTANFIAAQQKAGQNISRQRESYQAGLAANAFSNGGPSATAIGEAVAHALENNPKYSLSWDKNGFNIHEHDAHNRRLIQRNKHQLGKKGVSV